MAQVKKANGLLKLEAQAHLRPKTNVLTRGPKSPTRMIYPTVERRRYSYRIGI